MAQLQRNIQLGLKLGSVNQQYSNEIDRLYRASSFAYMELFALPESYTSTIDYWRQFDFPFVIHAPHTAAGMNLADPQARAANRIKIEETLRFADALDARYIIFHSGMDGSIVETVQQLKAYTDDRFLLENKPYRGVVGGVCVGSGYSDLQIALQELGCGFCFDFGHGVCAANSLGEDPVAFIRQMLTLEPALYHLTDGDYSSEIDMHLHYGEGSFPLKEFLHFVADGAMVTNESIKNSRESLGDFEEDVRYLSCLC